MKKKLEDKCIDLQAMEMAIFRSQFNLFDINHNARWLSDTRWSFLPNYYRNLKGKFEFLFQIAVIILDQMKQLSDQTNPNTNT